MSKNEISKVVKIENVFDDPVIAKHVADVLKENKDVFTASVIELYNNPESPLSDCNPKAVIYEALKAAALNLPISRSLGFVYIIPYSGNPSMQLGYKSFIQFAIRSGQYDVINADVVYEGELTSTDKLTGTFNLNGVKKSDKVIGYFAHVRQKNGFSKTLYMTRKQVEDHAKKYSKNYNSSKSLYKSHFDEMGIKTVLKALLSKYGNLSIGMQKVFDADVSDEIQMNANTQDISFETTASFPKHEKEPAIQEAEVVEEKQEPTRKPLF